MSEATRLSRPRSWLHARLRLHPLVRDGRQQTARLRAILRPSAWRQRPQSYADCLRAWRIDPADAPRWLRGYRLERNLYVGVLGLCVLQIVLGAWRAGWVQWLAGLVGLGIVGLLILVRGWQIRVLATGRFIRLGDWLRGER